MGGYYRREKGFKNKRRERERNIVRLLFDLEDLSAL